ncbi:hypothetical protein [Streptomyces sp. KL116D]|uniref:hypothetical protein n=1 Tax=Streptomyces sp. KL116D TaxID=3045152 RepID=UPI00355609D3
MTPYFIKLKVENVGGTDLSYLAEAEKASLRTDRGTRVILTGDIPVQVRQRERVGRVHHQGRLIRDDAA